MKVDMKVVHESRCVLFKPIYLCKLSAAWTLADSAPAGRPANLRSDGGEVKAGVRKTLAVWVASLAWIVIAPQCGIAQPRAIDPGKSVMTVRVYKAGLLSALGHNHEIAAPIAGGKVDATARQVELHTQARALQVRDPGVSEKDRTEIQSTLLGPEAL